MGIHTYQPHTIASIYIYISFPLLHPLMHVLGLFLLFIFCLKLFFFVYFSTNFFLPVLISISLVILITDISPNFVNFSYQLHLCYLAHRAHYPVYVPVVFTVWYTEAQLWPKWINRAPLAIPNEWWAIVNH